MADIFLSYAREDEARAATLARVLDARGWSVFWDRRIIAGTSWDEVVEREINNSKCVVVLWSTAAVTSRWVKTEARFGLQRDALVPASLDGTTIPLEFRFLESAQLQSWNGDVNHSEFQVLTEGISRHVQPRPDTSSPIAVAVGPSPVAPTGDMVRVGEAPATEPPPRLHAPKRQEEFAPELRTGRTWRSTVYERRTVIGSALAGLAVVVVAGNLLLPRNWREPTASPAVNQQSPQETTAADTALSAPVPKPSGTSQPPTQPPSASPTPAQSTPPTDARPAASRASDNAAPTPSAQPSSNLSPAARPAPFGAPVKFRAGPLEPAR